MGVRVVYRRKPKAPALALQLVDLRVSRGVLLGYLARRLADVQKELRFRLQEFRVHALHVERVAPQVEGLAAL